MIDPAQSTEQPSQQPATPPVATATGAETVQPPGRASIANDPLRRSPFLATILSLMPGLGQVYTGYYQRGFVHAIVVAGIITLLATGSLGPMTALASVFLAFFWLYNVIDAGRRAVLFNEALAGRADIDLPKDFSTPGLHGTILGGSILVIVGLVLLSSTLFDVSLDWLEDWWPVAIVVFGGFLIFKAMQERSVAEGSEDEDTD